MKAQLVLLAIVGLAAPLVVSWGASEALLTRAHSNETRFRRGVEVFQHQCATCHSLDATQRRLGPPLGEIGRVAGTRKPDTSAAEYLVESIANPSAFRAPGTTGGMPQGLVLREEELRELVGYLMSQGSEISNDELAALQIPDLQRANANTDKVDWKLVEQGEALFRGKGQCISCHLLHDDPTLTLRGPSLLSAASLSAADLRAAIETPGATIAPGYQQVVVERKDGRIVQGRLTEATDTGLWLLIASPSGQLSSEFVANTEIERLPLPVGEGTERDDRYTTSTVSLMPDTRDLLSREEVDSLVAFLKNRHGGQDK